MRASSKAGLFFSKFYLVKSFWWPILIVLVRITLFEKFGKYVKYTLETEKKEKYLTIIRRLDEIKIYSNIYYEDFRACL